jgi:hypothetical protein
MSKRNPTFLVGEIVTQVYSVTGLIPAGAEVEIVGPLMLRDIEGIPGARGMVSCVATSFPTRGIPIPTSTRRPINCENSTLPETR